MDTYFCSKVKLLLLASWNCMHDILLIL